MKDISKPALDAVMNGEVHLHPSKFRNLYRHWMENVHDWCISRQLWWGHRIPAWYYNNGEFVVAENAERALQLAREKSGNPSLGESDLRQDEDVLDTWFSSWLWPITSFDGINDPGNRDLKYYYPTNDLITAPEILFFWVARMIIAGYEYMGERPFSNVYLTGLVRDQQRRKMSKSLGNSPEPLDLIRKYGADGVRVGMLLCSPAGNDLLYDDSLPEQGRNFANKIWNAFRLVKGWKVDDKLTQPESSASAVKWMNEVIKKSLAEIDSDFKKFRISGALMAAYKLFWDEFSGWYLEIVKPEYKKPVDRLTYDSTIAIFDNLLRIIHPFMPFITEEIWQIIGDRKEGESIMISSLPRAKKHNRDIIEAFEKVRQIVSNVRTVRKEKQLAVKDAIELAIKAEDGSFAEENLAVIKKLCNISDVKFVTVKLDNSAAFMVGTTEFYIPMGDKIDVKAERIRIEADLSYYRGFLESVMKKLGNERFMKNAPQPVIELEQKKRTDTELKIQALEEALKGLETASGS
jgi:valyl-tRNA synthetase